MEAPWKKKGVWPVHLHLLLGSLGRMELGAAPAIPASIHYSRGPGTLTGDFSEALNCLWKAPHSPKNSIWKGTLMCPLSRLSCPSSRLLLVHSSLLEEAEKPKPNTSISLEPFLLLCPWMTFWTLSLFLCNMDSTYFCTVRKNLFWTLYSCHEEGMLHPDCPSPNFFRPLVRCVAVSAWSASPNSEPLEALTTQALVVLEISCDRLTALTVHSLLLILQ